MNNSMSDTKRVIVFSIIIVLVISLIGISSYFLLKEKNNDNTIEKKNTKNIEGYGITLDDLDTEVFKVEFDKLKKNLESDNINYDDYAESVAKLFVIDLYTIKNKINKYDVGGIEFVFPEARDNYINNVTDTIYNYVLDNTDGKRTQQLPVVKEVSSELVKKDKFAIKETKESYDSYVFSVNISYVNDFGYDKKAEIIVINKDNFMYVVEKN